MRKELEAFIEESFAGLPPSPETEQAKAQVRKQLEADAAVYRAKGMAPWAADQHAMMRFGAVAGARESVARLHRRAIRARFRRRYPKLVKGGILTLTIGPIAAAIL